MNKKNRIFFFTTFVILVIVCLGVDHKKALPTTPSSSDLCSSSLAKTWDEAIPLGNATIGQLVWQMDSTLRFSLDQSDLWDLRPTDEFEDTTWFRYSWIKEQIKAKNFDAINRMGDTHYQQEPGPSKIPCAALTFPANPLGEVVSTRLLLNDGLCRIEWENGTMLETFVNANKPVGWFIFRGLDDKFFHPSIVEPNYNRSSTAVANAQASGELCKLGYEKGVMTNTEHSSIYRQKGWGDFIYEVAVQWKRKGKTLIGVWSVSCTLSEYKASDEVAKAMSRGIKADYASHRVWWADYWKQSSVCLPDSVLQRQYDNDMYKLGSTSREHSRPISLQAVWTADNGLLPPWKGDYHNDLNTQLSYWPVYTGNHLKEGLAYLNTQWELRDKYQKFAHDFFETNGLMIPGVATLDGKPMGGWVQYSLSPTTAAWVAHHFCLHWKYSADETFLHERALPFCREVAQALEEVSVQRTNEEGKSVRTLEVSTSPEVYDNSPRAWFHTITNYDLALIRFLFGAVAEMATADGELQEAAHWQKCCDEMPDFDLDDMQSLTLAKGFPYNESHRHFSHLMAIHPLGLIDQSQGKEAQRIIRASINRLDSIGPALWVGFSYAWLGNLKARALDGNGAAEALRIFAECFCLPNTFHVNGDQTHSGKSNFTYRPFTLEGNFAFAAGVQEMLLQSHTGVLRVFPALPDDWKDVSFSGLRAMGAFVVSATMEQGKVKVVRIFAEKGGRLAILLPGDSKPRKYETNPGEWIVLSPTE